MYYLCLFKRFTRASLVVVVVTLCFQADSRAKQLNFSNLEQNNMSLLNKELVEQ